MKRLTIVIVMIFSSLVAKSITIEECYRLLHDNYPLIRQYDLNLQLEQFSFSNAARSYLPQVALSGQATYQSDVAAFPDEMNTLYQRIGIDFQGLTRDQYKLMLQLNQLIWDGGVSKARQELSAAEENVAQLTVDKELDAIKNRVNQIYFGILVMQSNLQTNLYVDTLLHNNLKVIESAVKNGVAMSSDLDQITVEILSLEQQRTQITNNIVLYRKMMSLMIGREISETEVFEIPSVPTIDQMLNNRTELKLFDAQKLQLETQRKMVNSNIMPRFDIFAQGWYGRPGLNLFEDMLYNHFSWNYIAGIRFQWNISGFYTRKNHLNQLQVQSNSIDIQKDVFLWNLNLQQSQLESEIEKMRDLQEKDTQIVTLRQSIRKASESKYRNGIITATDLLSDITNENRAMMLGNIHELDMLRSIYDLKTTLNQ
ncbi:MAG: TolC family protein [Bacteroidales bacterium]|nr:TolC family protein [Bacteroidales bacterium]